MDQKPFVTLSSLADRTGLPLRWLKAEADARRIPFLIVGNRPMFNPASVERALAERAQSHVQRAEVALA